MSTKQTTQLKPKTDPMPYGFKDFNGGLWCNAWVDSYNALSKEIESINPHNTSKLNFYLDQRHRLFVLHMELAQANGVSNANN